MDDLKISPFGDLKMLWAMPSSSRPHQAKPHLRPKRCPPNLPCHNAVAKRFRPAEKRKPLRSKCCRQQSPLSSRAPLSGEEETRRDCCQTPKRDASSLLRLPLEESPL